MGILTTTTFVLTIANIALLLWLGWIYGRNAVRMPNVFSVGLLAFCVLFLIQNGLYVYFVSMMMSYYAPGLDVPAFVMTLCQTAGFGILAYLGRK